MFTSGYSARTKTYYMATYDDPTIVATPVSDFDATSNKLQTK